MDVIDSLFGRSGYLPHGYCFTWSPGLLWAMVGADTMTALSYFSIPLALVGFVRRRPAVNQGGVAWLFCLFIFACGLTHVMDIWTIWRPDYGVQALTKTVTAVVSLVTAVALWPLLKKALLIPTVTELQDAISALQAEVQHRKTAEDSLRDTEQSLVVTLASIGAGFMTTDEQGRVTRMNAVAEQVTGWPEGEARGHLLWDVFRPEGRPAEATPGNPLAVLAELAMAADTAWQVIAVSREGTRTGLEVKAAFTHDGNGQARGVAVVFRDVTRLNAGELASRRLAAIVQSSKDAIIGKDLNGIVTDWNQAAERMFGYSAEEMIGSPVTLVLPADRLDEEVRILDALRHGHEVPNFDTVRRRKDGHLLEVSVSISPIHDVLGRVVGASKIARDITEIKRTEAELRRSNAELEQFAYVASHDLQEPLRMVVNYTELLAQRYEGALDEKAQKYLHYASDGARRMQRLVNDLLAYSRIGSQGKAQVPVSADAVLQTVLTTLRRLIRDNQATVQAAPLPTVLGDDLQLQQLFQNLITNAIKFRGVEPPHISVQAVAHEAGWLFTVADNGIGMEMQYAERIFQMFQRLHELGKYEGSGMGLAIAKRIVERHGGWITVESAPGLGSRFTFILRAASP